MIHVTCYMNLHDPFGQSDHSRTDMSVLSQLEQTETRQHVQQSNIVLGVNSKRP